MRNLKQVASQVAVSVRGLCGNRVATSIATIAAIATMIAIALFQLATERAHESQLKARELQQMPSGNQLMITGFKSVTCGKISCVEVSSPQAWLSSVGGYSTDSQTTLKVLELSGRPRLEFAGTSANYNELLALVTLDCANGGIAMYDLTLEKSQTMGCEPVKEN